MTSCQWPAWQITLRMIHHALHWFMIQASGFRILGAFLLKMWLRFTAARSMRKKILEVEVQKIMTRWSSSSRQPGVEISQWDKNQTWSSVWLKISLLQMEFGFRNRGYSCLWNPESSNFSLWNPEFWALESGIRLKESTIPLEIWIWIQVHLTKKLESSIWNLESTAWIPLHGTTNSLQWCLRFYTWSLSLLYNPF